MQETELLNTPQIQYVSNMVQRYEMNCIIHPNIVATSFELFETGGSLDSAPVAFYSGYRTVVLVRSDN